MLELKPLPWSVSNAVIAATAKTDKGRDYVYIDEIDELNKMVSVLGSMSEDKLASFLKRIYGMHHDMIEDMHVGARRALEPSFLPTFERLCLVIIQAQTWTMIELRKLSKNVRELDGRLQHLVDQDKKGGK